MPAPSQRSQRPPGTLKEKWRGREFLLARLRLGGEHLADRGEGVGVGGGVGAGGAPDRALIDGDDLIQVLPAVDRIVRARAFIGAEELPARRAVEDVEQQRGFSRARGAGDGDEQPERQGDGEVFQVVFARPADDERLAVRCTARMVRASKSSRTGTGR